jgi:hypothetical protein
VGLRIETTARLSAGLASGEANAELGRDFPGDRPDRRRPGLHQHRGPAIGIAKILFYVFLVLFLVSLVSHLFRGGRGAP